MSREGYLKTATDSTEVLDVVIVGAGLAGIGTAYRLQERCPEKKFIILEARENIGGTWDLFKYPGVRSDSDMFTFGYKFRPWQNPQSLSNGEEILRYIKETARENNIDKKISFDHKVTSASWSFRENLWTLEVSHGSINKKISTRFLYMCSGYFSYKEAHRPHFEEQENFKGKIVQPQFWPKDLNYSKKRVVVIGSGATAVTLVPTMAQTAAHVTMLQRSPTYVMNLPNRNKFFIKLKKWLPDTTAYRITRRRNLLLTMTFYKISRIFPGWVKNLLKKSASKQLGEELNVEKHFTPRYNPWDQRLCVVPDGDLFKGIRQKKASVVTDHIDRFTRDGILLKSGEELKADIVVLATGLKIELMGGATIKVEDNVVDPNKSMVYKGMMISDVPNFAIAFGYTNASWTLKTDLTANYVCKLLHYMDRKEYMVVVPRKKDGVEPEPFLDFESGYIKRAKNILPQQGSRKPWRVYQNYLQDMLTIRYGRIQDGELEFRKEGDPFK